MQQLYYRSRYLYFYSFIGAGFLAVSKETPPKKSISDCWGLWGFVIQSPGTVFEMEIIKQIFLTRFNRGYDVLQRPVMAATVTKHVH